MQWNAKFFKTLFSKLFTTSIKSYMIHLLLSLHWSLISKNCKTIEEKISNAKQSFLHKAYATNLNNILSFKSVKFLDKKIKIK